MAGGVGAGARRHPPSPLPSLASQSYPSSPPPTSHRQRGAGNDQPIMRTVAGEVGAGRWVHVFPEGRVEFTGQLAPLRWGVGKLICDSLKHSER